MSDNAFNALLNFQDVNTVNVLILPFTWLLPSYWGVLNKRKLTNRPIIFVFFAKMSIIYEN